MALIKNVQTDFGIEASYWRLSEIRVNIRIMQVSFDLELYYDKTAKNPLQTKSILCTLDEETFKKYFMDLEHITCRNIYNACYLYAKEHEEFFKDAEDDPDELALQETLKENSTSENDTLDEIGVSEEIVENNEETP